MSKRPFHYALLVTLILIGTAAGYVTWDLHQQNTNLLNRERLFNRELNSFFTTTAELGAAQQAYVVPGQQDASWLEHVSLLLEQLQVDVSDIQLLIAVAENRGRLDVVARGVESLIEIDRRAREYLEVRQELMAADLLFTEGRNTLSVITANLQELRSREQGYLLAVSAEISARQFWVLVGFVATWLSGLFLLGLLPHSVNLQETNVVSDKVDEQSSSNNKQELKIILQEHPSIDLNKIVKVCNGLSRLIDAKALPAILADLANVLSASGVIVWLADGNQLHAVSAHGYEPATLKEFSPISHSAKNATATAWQSAKLQTVPGDLLMPGAIVAPIFGAKSCCGVLTIEVQQGCESDLALRALTEIFAAQLAAILGIQSLPATATGSETVLSSDTAATA